MYFAIYILFRYKNVNKDMQLNDPTSYFEYKDLGVFYKSRSYLAKLKHGPELTHPGS